MSYDPRKDFSISQTHGMLEIQPAIAQSLISAYENNGPNAVFTIAATGVGLTYEWQVLFPEDAETNDWKIIKGENLPRLAVGGLDGTPEFYDNCKFRCRVYNKAGSVLSDEATLTLKKATSAPEITTQPESVSIKAGSYADYDKRRFAKYIISLNSGGGGQGENDYATAINKPQINGTTLQSGDNTLESLGIVQSDFNESDTTSLAYIANKPNISSGGNNAIVYGNENAGINKSTHYIGNTSNDEIVSETIYTGIIEPVSNAFTINFEEPINLTSIGKTLELKCIFDDSVIIFKLKYLNQVDGFYIDKQVDIASTNNSPIISTITSAADLLNSISLGNINSGIGIYKIITYSCK